MEYAPLIALIALLAIFWSIEEFAIYRRAKRQRNVVRSTADKINRDILEACKRRAASTFRNN